MYKNVLGTGVREQKGSVTPHGIPVRSGQQRCPPREVRTWDIRLPRDKIIYKKPNQHLLLAFPNYDTAACRPCVSTSSLCFCFDYIILINLQLNIIFIFRCEVFTKWFLNCIIYYYSVVDCPIIVSQYQTTLEVGIFLLVQQYRNNCR